MVLAFAYIYVLVQQVISDLLTPALSTPNPASHTSTSMTINMSGDSAPSCTSYVHIPVLTKAKFLEWQIGVKAYLDLGKQLHVIKHRRISSGVFVDISPPTDLNKLTKWRLSEEIAIGAIVTTTSKLHLELISKHKDSSI